MSDGRQARQEREQRRQWENEKDREDRLDRYPAGALNAANRDRDQSIGATRYCSSLPSGIV